MAKLISTFLALWLCLSVPALAMSDTFGSLVEWEVYVYEFKIRGYPHYNASLQRYDFYDYSGCYTGCVAYNPLTDKWEYFKL